jgi:2-methylcitrate dehydratase PrpD
MYPQTISLRLKAKANDGRVIDLWPRDPLGHVNKPMGDEDVKNKFRQTVESLYGGETTARILERWWEVKDASAETLAELLTLLDVKK